MPKAMIHEVETIAHSVGVTEPRQMRRIHVRIVQDSGRSVLMSRLYPRSREPARADLDRPAGRPGQPRQRLTRPAPRPSGAGAGKPAPRQRLPRSIR
jgi:hypothetical protein